MILQRQLVLPAGFRRGRIPVRLASTNTDYVRLLPVAQYAEATHQIVDALGIPLVTHLSDRDHYISTELMKYGAWELAQSQVLLSLIRPGMTIVDAGANIGYFSVMFSRAVGETGAVFAIEPESENYFLLKVNRELLRQLEPQTAPITLWKGALTDRAGTAWLQLFEQNRGFHSLVHSGGMRREEVRTAALDQEYPHWTDRPLDLLKSDTQGSELTLFRGARELIRRDQPVLCFEFEPHLNGSDYSLEVLHEVVRLGYSRFRLFQATQTDSYQSILERLRWWSESEIVQHVRSRMVSSNSTLLAWPDHPRVAYGS